MFLIIKSTLRILGKGAICNSFFVGYCSRNCYILHHSALLGLILKDNLDEVLNALETILAHPDTPRDAAVLILGAGRIGAREFQHISVVERLKLYAAISNGSLAASRLRGLRALVNCIGRICESEIMCLTENEAVRAKGLRDIADSCSATLLWLRQLLP